MTAKHYEPIDIHKAKVVAWPEKLPTMTGAEAVRAASRLWRWALSEQCPYDIKETSGNRHSWTAYEGTFPNRRKVLRVNPTSGWRRFIHDLSHLFVRRENPDEKPHGKFHAKFEAKLIREVLKRGWLDGRLQDAPAPVTTADDRKKRKLEAINARIERWEAKERRAHRAVVKLNKTRRYYERQLEES